MFKCDAHCIQLHTYVPHAPSAYFPFVYALTIEKKFRKTPYYGADVSKASNVSQKKSKSRKNSGPSIKIRPRSPWPVSFSTPRTKDSKRRKLKVQSDCCDDNSIPQERPGDGGHFTFYENTGGGGKSHSYFWVPGAEKTITSPSPTSGRRSAPLKSDARAVVSIVRVQEKKTEPESFLDHFEKFRSESRSIANVAIRFLVDEFF